MKPAARIETERLVLRPVHLADAPGIARSYAADPEVTRFLSWRPHRRLDETHVFLRGLLRRQRAGECRAWIVASRDGGEVLGMIEARLSGSEADLGYVLARRAWGRGLMTEAVGAIVAALHEAAATRITASTDPENHGSRRVLEKSGFRREGVREAEHLLPNLGPEPRDAELWAR